jgi:hypothetical protein
MITVKYTPKLSQNAYEYKSFFTYDELGRWYTAFYNLIVVWDIITEY